MILVLRALGLGDLLAAVPALRAIRARWSEEVVLACPGWLTPLAELTGAVDRVLPTPGLVPLPDLSPSVAINLHGAGPQSTALLAATRPGVLISHGDPPWRDDLHERDRWCRLLHAHGITADPADLHLPLPDTASPAPGAVVIHPGAAFGSRRWPADRYAAVAEHFPNVVVTGSAEEQPLAHQVAGDHGTVLAGRTSLPELAALVAEAALVISGDTGIAHLAYAYGTPSITLFGPVGPQQWGPPPGPHTTLTASHLRRGDPFADEPDPALVAITPEDVVSAALQRQPHGG